MTYHRRTGDEIDRKVVATVIEPGQITNGVVQTLFDVRVERASRIISDMVERSILVKNSAHERGPRVTYGLGSKFPSRKQPRLRRTADVEADAFLPFGPQMTTTSRSARSATERPCSVVLSNAHRPPCWDATQ